METIFFTSDLHFGHQSLLPGRPDFSTIEEHDAFLIRQWNRKVTEEDHVYILGDLSFRAEHDIAYYLDQLKGKKHLIVGNHDHWWLKRCSQEFLAHYFQDVSKLTQIRYAKMNLSLCHYPMLEWSGSGYRNGSSFLLHGHIHGQRDSEPFRYIQKNLPHALNACVDVNHFEPVTFEELCENNSEWYGRSVTEPWISAKDKMNHIDKQ